MASTTLTFLLTDIEGSTSLWELAPEEMREALLRHDEIVRQNIEAAGGRLVKERGEGDSHFCVFSSASQAVEAAARLQLAMRSQSWPTPEPLTLRIAIHTGEVFARDSDFYGPAVNRAARLRSIGHGGQTLLSLATREVLATGLPEGFDIRDLGEHRLKDLMRPEHVFELTVSGAEPAFPALGSIQPELNNLPVQLTSFVGREEEMAILNAHLLSHRLVTLTGPGGCGKTRLALQCAAEVAEEFPGGVWLIALAAVSEPDGVVPAVARVLGVQERAGEPLLDSVARRLSEAPTLLILDNCEHLGGTPATLADALLRKAPTVTILATSRRALNLSAEYVHIVRPLEVPTQADSTDLERLSSFESVQLMLDRTAARAPNFSLTQANAASFAALCAALQGIPLAIELAASKHRLLSPEQILAKLGQSLDLLKGGTEDTDLRHRTLRATIEWSYQQLTEDEQWLMRRISAFPAGCTLGTLEFACDDAPADLIDLLDGLVSHSLLTVDTASETRYRMLETIRQFAAERLNPAETEHANSRLFAWSLDLARTSKPLLVGESQHEWVSKLESEYGNLRAALAWACERPDGENLALQLASELDRFWQRAGMLREGQQWLEKTLGLPLDTPQVVRGLALRSAGTFAWQLNDHERAISELVESLSILEKLGDRAGEAAALANLGIVHSDLSRYEEAARYFEASLNVYRSLDDPMYCAYVLINFGAMYQEQKQMELAKSTFLEALAYARRSTDKYIVARVLANLGSLGADSGEVEETAAHLRESLELGIALNNMTTVAWTLCYMSMLAYREQHYELSARLFGFSAAVRQGIQVSITKQEAHRLGLLEANLTEALGGRAMAEAIELGTTMSSEEIADYALRGLDLVLGAN